MGGNFHVICGYVSVIDIYLFPIYISIGVHKAMRSMMRRAQRCIEIAELISPEIFSHMGITNINCMYGNVPRAINQNDHKATGLREYCCHLFLQKFRKQDVQNVPKICLNANCLQACLIVRYIVFCYKTRTTIFSSDIFPRKIKTKLSLLKHVF